MIYFVDTKKSVKAYCMFFVSSTLLGLSWELQQSNRWIKFEVIVLDALIELDTFGPIRGVIPILQWNQV